MTQEASYMSKVKFLAWAVLAAGLAMPTASAVAVSAYAGGAHAWSPAQNDAGKIAVKDNSGDGDPVKTEYYRVDSMSTLRTLWNHSGYNTTAYSADGAKINRFRAIDENNAAPDDISDWVATP